MQENPEPPTPDIFESVPTCWLVGEFILYFLGPGSMASLPSAAFGSIYQKLWTGMAALEQDPYPAASQMAKQVMDYIRDQVSCTFCSLIIFLLLNEVFKTFIF